MVVLCTVELTQIYNNLPHQVCEPGKCFGSVWYVVAHIGGSTHQANALGWQWYISRVGQNRIYTPYMTVYLVISLPIIPYVNRKYIVLANPIYKSFNVCTSTQSRMQ